MTISQTLGDPVPATPAGTGRRMPPPQAHPPQAAGGSISRIGLLGAGYISEWHAKSLRQIPGVETVAVCDRAVDRARALAAKFGIPSAYASLDEMLAGGRLDAVHVLLPPELHFDAAMAALKAGVGVLLEKPMCTRAEECADLARVAAERGLRLGTGHNFLFYPAWERLRDDVAAGLLGRVDHVTIDWNKDLPQARFGPFDMWMLRDPRNIMLEIGPHSVSQMLDLVGIPDSFDVRATNSVELPSGVPFYRRWQVQAYKGHTAIDLNFSFIPGSLSHVVHVRGNLGTATLDFERNTYVLRRHSPAGIDFDRYLTTRAEAKTLRSQGWRNLKNYVLSKAKLSKDGNVYGSSIRRAMEAFYAPPAAAVDARISAEMGRETIAICQEIGRRADLPDVAAPAITAPATAAPSVAPRILVLGATGFIGQELVRQLIRHHPVRLLARSPGKLPPDLRTPMIEVVRGDISDAADLDKALRGIDVVYHLARAQVKTWADYETQEIGITRLVAERCIAAKVKRFIYTGTIDSYYAGAAGSTITESTPLDRKIAGRNYYARAKAVSEDLLMRMHREQNLPVVIFRPGIVIGAGGSPLHWGVGMWQHDAVCLVWGNGNHPLPLVLVEDVAKGLVAGLEATGIEGLSFNLVGPPTLSAREYMAALEKCSGMKFDVRPTAIGRFYLTDMAKWCVKMLVRHPDRRRPTYRDWNSRAQRAVFDCSRTIATLKWQPTTDRDELIRRGIEVPAREVWR